MVRTFARMMVEPNRKKRLALTQADRSLVDEFLADIQGRVQQA